MTDELDDISLDEAVDGMQQRPMHDGNYPTDEQEAIFVALEDTDDHLVVDAKAGSGKTSTLVECVRRAIESGIATPQQTLNLCFNKPVQVELEEKMPDGVWNKTLDAYGLSLIANEHGGYDNIEVDTDRDKSKVIIDDHIPYGIVKRTKYSPIRDWTDLCKCYMVEEPEQALSIARSHGLTMDFNSALATSSYSIEDVAYEIPEVLDAMAEDSRRVEFSDMSWLPIREDYWVFPKDLVFVDEAQDLNQTNHMLLKRLISRGGRVIAVGDPFQSLYLFRGALPDSMDRLQSMLESTSRDVTKLPLSVTFRCPTRVVDVAQRIVPDFKAFRDEPGVVRHADPMLAVEEVEPGDTVLCGKNAPLLSFAYRLIGEETPAMVRGRDIGRGLAYTTERVAGQKNKRTNRGLDTDEFLDKLDEWRARQLDKAGEDMDKRQRIQDRYACLRIVAERNATVGDMLDSIDGMFGGVRDSSIDWGNVVELSTVHRVKGKESDTVYILNPAEDLQFGAQGRNIVYVACTRAKEELVFLGDLPPSLGGGQYVPPEERSRRDERRQEEAALADEARQMEEAEEKSKSEMHEEGAS